MIALRVTAIFLTLIGAAQLAAMSRGIYPSHLNQVGWVCTAGTWELVVVFMTFRKRNS